MHGPVDGFVDVTLDFSQVGVDGLKGILRRVQDGRG